MERLAPKGGRTRAALVVTVSRAVSYIIRYLNQLVIAALLSPNDFGILAAVISVVGLAIPLSSIGLSEAAIKFASADKKNAKDYVTTIVATKTLAGFVLFLLFWWFSGMIAAFYRLSSVTPIIFLAFAYFLQSASSLNTLLIINGDFTRYALLDNLVLVAQLILTSVLVYFYRLNGVFYAMSLAYVFAALLYLRVVGLGKFRPDLLKKMHLFGAALLFTQILTYVIQNVDKIALGRFATKELLANYSLAFAAAAALVFVPTAVQTVLFPSFSEFHAKKNGREVQRLFYKAIKNILVISAACAVAIVVVAWFVFSFVITKYTLAVPILLRLIVPFVLEAGLGVISVAFFAAIGRLDIVLRVKLMQTFFALCGYLLTAVWGLNGAILSIWAICLSNILYFYDFKKYANEERA